MLSVSEKSRSYLRIKRVRQDDAGRYQCHAVNVLGRAVSNVTTLVTLSGTALTRIHSE